MPSASRPVKGRRRELFAEATREALVDAATELFVERGFAGTALADVAARADASRGAVYHHFDDKAALYEAVMERQGAAAVERVAAAAAGATDSWQTADLAIEAFLDLCTDPVYSTIVWREGPSALGWARWRECEHRFGYGLTSALVKQLTDEGLVEPVPHDLLTRVVFAMIGEAGLNVAEAPRQEQDQVKQDCSALLRRLIRALAVTGA